LSEEKIYDDRVDTLMLAIMARLVVRHKLRINKSTLEERASFENKTRHVFVWNERNKSEWYLHHEAVVRNVQ
jgi:hypothetical protein